MRKLIIGLLLAAGLLVFSAAGAAAQEESMDQLIEELEQVLLYLALHDSLDTSQTSKVRGDLANIHRRMSALEAGMATTSSPPYDPAQPDSAYAPEVGEPATDSASPATDEEANAGEPAVLDVPLLEDNLPPADSGPLPEHDGGGWSPWASALRNVSPDGATFAGWKKDSRIDLSWGEYGEVRLDIVNGELSAGWTIREAYDGNDINVNVVSGSDGNIVIQVTDDNGRHDFLLTEGGAGRLYQRTTKGDGSVLALSEIADELVAIEAKTAELEQAIAATEAQIAIAEDSTSGDDAAVEESEAEAEQIAFAEELAADEVNADEAAAGERVEWEARYKEEVRAGSRERYPAMDWFMEQAASGSYSNEALAVLGRFLNADSGEGNGGAIGELVYSVNDNEKTVQFPDPRRDTTEFINFINKAYILTQSDTPFVISLYY